MTHIEDLQTQVRRMQAMLTAYEHLFLAIFENLPNQEAIHAAFEQHSQTIQDLLAKGAFSDLEREDGRMAINFLLSSLTNAMKRGKGP